MRSTTGSAIDRFLDTVRTGRVSPELYTEDARLDATVPGWRFQAQGPVQIAAEYSSWFASPSDLQTLERIPIPGGEVVRYVHTFDLGGKQHAAHHVHLLQ